MSTLKDILNEPDLKENILNSTVSNSFKLNESVDSKIILQAVAIDDFTNEHIPLTISFKESLDKCHTTISVESVRDNNTITVPNNLIKDCINSILLEHTRDWDE